MISFATSQMLFIFSNRIIDIYLKDLRKIHLVISYKLAECTLNL